HRGELFVVEDALPELRHAAGADPCGLGDLQGIGAGDRGRVGALPERPAGAGGVVAAGAVRRVQLLPERQVRTLDVQLGDLGTLPERGDVRDEVGDLVGAVRRWLAEGLVALAGAGGHAPGGQVEVGGRGARVLQRRA